VLTIPSDPPLAAGGEIAIRAHAVDATGATIRDRAPRISSAARETIIALTDSVGTAESTRGVAYARLVGVTPGVTSVVAELEGRFESIAVVVAPRAATGVVTGVVTGR